MPSFAYRKLLEIGPAKLHGVTRTEDYGAGDREARLIYVGAAGIRIPSWSRERRPASGDELMCLQYALHMRITISLDDRLARRVRREAAAQGLSVSAFIGKTLDDAIKRREPTMDRPFRLITVGGGGPSPGIDLDRPRGLAAAEEELRFGTGDGSSPHAAFRRQRTDLCAPK